jgi:hypothetical protein
MKLFSIVFVFFTFFTANANAYITANSLNKSANGEALTPAKAYELRLEKEKKNKPITTTSTINEQAQSFHNSFKKNISNYNPPKKQKGGSYIPSVASGMFVK